MNRLLTCGILLLGAVAAYAQAPPAPGPEHQQLAHEAGVWKAATKMWPSPDAEPELGEGLETNAMLGPMWLVGKFESEFGGQPYTGHSQSGYDPVAKKYIGTWIDSMSPYMMTMEGDYDAATKTLTMIGTGRDWMTGEVKEHKLTTEYVDADHKVFKMFMKNEAGEWPQLMEIDYTREKK